MGKKRMIKRLCILTLLAWFAFLFFDGKMNSLREEKIETNSSTYPEIYGPVSYFTPRLKYAAFAFTFALTVLSWRQSNMAHPDGIVNADKPRD
jgi:hypothetical protein